MSELPVWPYRRKMSCLFWGIGQKMLYGGKGKVIRSPHGWGLLRVLWSPDPKAKYPAGEWFSYVPINPMKAGLDPWWRVLKHSLWFEGRVRREKPRGERA